MEISGACEHGTCLSIAPLYV